MEQSNSHDYAVIRMADVPEVHVEMLGADRYRRSGCPRHRADDRQYLRRAHQTAAAPHALHAPAVWTVWAVAFGLASACLMALASC